ncbi:MAG: DUF4363 family protein [Oscillospiraceae bacterium]|nr:DUF4363 family protein [Oscillospiraceae bacterium]
MKALYIPIGLLAVILGFSLWTGQYVAQRTSQWTALLEEVDRLARQEDWGQAEERLKEAYACWDASQTFFHTIMNHDELDQAEELFAGAFAVCREADSADFHMFLFQLQSQLRLLAETQSLSVKNVL